MKTPPQKHNKDRVRENMSRNIVTIEEAQNRHEKMKDYLSEVSFKDAVEQCFFERGWSPMYYTNIQFDEDRCSFILPNP